MAAGRVAAGFVIFRRLQKDIQYLFLQTSYGRHHWTPPKGHVDPGESELEAAIRETEEEAGLLQDKYRILGSFKQVLKYSAHNAPKTVIYWLAELINPDTPIELSNEHRDYKWLRLDDAMACAEFQGMQEVLRKAEKYINEN